MSPHSALPGRLSNGESPLTTTRPSTTSRWVTTHFILIENSSHVCTCVDNPDLTFRSFLQRKPTGKRSGCFCGEEGLLTSMPIYFFDVSPLGEKCFWRKRIEFHKQAFSLQAFPLSGAPWQPPHLTQGKVKGKAKGKAQKALHLPSL